MSDENYMAPLVKILHQLKEKGYTADFLLTNEGILSKTTNEVFKPEDLIIEKVYRFEGNSNPDDMAVMYAINAGSGTKGVIIDAYGTYENENLTEFLKNVKIIENNSQ
ncbi:MAG TPA: hypothetical protein PKD83_05140 [Ignavibacteria bacterium]|nr:hypothetical protein [Ignavibacteria bacterium]